MKLEFLDDIDDDSRFPSAYPKKLIRLYEFGGSEPGELIKIIKTNLIGKRNHVDLEILDFVQLINCNLILQVSEIDKGITTLDGQCFVCNLSIENYKNMVSLMEPFRDKETNGYQWLYGDDVDTEIKFLFSPGGSL